MTLDSPLDFCPACGEALTLYPDCGDDFEPTGSFHAWWPATDERGPYHAISCGACQYGWDDFRSGPFTLRDALTTWPDHEALGKRIVAMLEGGSDDS